MFKIYMTYLEDGSEYCIWDTSRNYEEGTDPDAAALDTAKYLGVLVQNAAEGKGLSGTKPRTYRMVYEVLN